MIGSEKVSICWWILFFPMDRETLVDVIRGIAEQTDAHTTSRFKQMVHSAPTSLDEALDLEEQATFESFLRLASRSA